MLIMSLRGYATLDRIIADARRGDLVAVSGDHAIFSYAAEDDGGLVSFDKHGFLKFSAIAGNTKVEGTLVLTNNCEAGYILSLDVYRYITYRGEWQWHAGWDWGCPTQTDIQIPRSVGIRNRLLRMSQRLCRCRTLSSAQVRETLAEILHIIGG